MKPNIEYLMGVPQAIHSMMPRCYKHRGVISFGIGGETIRIYDPDDGKSYRVLHIKVDFWNWHIHWDVRISKKIQLFDKPNEKAKET
jgi:hypothetical protein